ncbi:MAG: DUF1573 domain-containing protein [Bacteroidota bacterium]|nr:DUF1573 domain-containing protein [Bacteroidota bacterium]
MKKYIIIVFAFSAWVKIAQAQVPADTLGRILWEKSEYLFGNINEVDGKVDGIFYFLNVGKVPVKIDEVKTSCGCTIAEYSKGVIKPNEKGFVKATFDPTMKKGEFNKSITVKANTVPYYHLLDISGSVIPRPQGPTDWYPNKFGHLRMTTNHFAMDKVKTNKAKTTATKIYNEGTEPIKLLGFESPSYIKFTPSKMEILPGETIELLATLDGKTINDYGFIFAEAKMNTTDPDLKQVGIFVSANVEEFFPDTSKKFMAKAPNAFIASTTHDFGTIKDNEHVSTNFVIKNMGKTDLIIHKAKADCGCTVPKLEKTVIKPGETGNVAVIYNPTNKTGLQSKNVQVMLNDPRQPMINLTIKANVVKVTEE